MHAHILFASASLSHHVSQVWGQGFARYLPASLLVLFRTIPCAFPDLNPLAITCNLRDANLADVPRDVFLPVQLQLGERVSEAVAYVALAVDGPPPVVGSSSGGGGGEGGGGGVDDDELVGMKLALLSMMILSFIVLLVALIVWVTGWWLAHRRSYVSQHGQAAVDARQVLLQ